MYVRWVDDNLRFGLFAGRNLRSGEVLGVYAGEFEWKDEKYELAEYGSYFDPVKLSINVNLQANMWATTGRIMIMVTILQSLRVDSYVLSIAWPVVAIH